MLFKIFITLIAIVSIKSFLIKRTFALKSRNYNVRMMSASPEVKSPVNLTRKSASRIHLDRESLNYNPTYFFGKKSSNSDDFTSFNKMKSLLGGKGSYLRGMSEINLPVPPGFTITTEVCSVYNQAGHIPEDIWNSILSSIKELETTYGRSFNDPDLPLLVSVRSGAAVSMPGMMDTVLNLGINDVSVVSLSKTFGEKFAYDSYRRFLNMFGSVVFNIPHSEFENKMKLLKAKYSIQFDSEFDASHLKELVSIYKEVYKQNNKIFPEDPIDQLSQSIKAVFDSWESERAKKYREAEQITGLLGTAVNIQAMVFGNLNEKSGTGVCFTRNPNTGTKELYGEYLINAQGEDVVAGIRTPDSILSLKDKLPEAYNELLSYAETLESNYHDMQDIEFTIQDGKLYMLQTRSAKRSGNAAVKFAIDMVQEKLGTVKQSVMTVKPEHIKQLLHPTFTDTESKHYKESVIATGLPASPGGAVGKIAFNTEQAEKYHAVGEDCILVRMDTSPEDITGMLVSSGILTATGGYTSHASVVARGWGKPCICGSSSLSINEENETLMITTKAGELITLKTGDYISINGDTGEVLLGKQKLTASSFDDSIYITTIMKWIDEIREVKVLANADTPEDALKARKNGAEGIGLVRTEHMFFADDRITTVRKMILSYMNNNKKNCQDSLNQLLIYQRRDMEGILEAMDNLPVTVRLLDPPLHEFLPKLHPLEKVTSSSTDFVINNEFSKEMDMSIEDIMNTVQKLEEVNPMLGFRGCRLGVMIPELVEMQTRALIEAALNNKYLKGLNPIIEIMIPLVSSSEEFSHQKQLITNIHKLILSERPGQNIDLKIGTMIEIPRAALIAPDIVKAGAEFFSYGTNDLTQMTYGLSRDDIGTFLPEYLHKKIFEFDPFENIDELGVGELIKMSSTNGKKAYNQMYNLKSVIQSKFKCGICGEHGGDYKSVKFFSKIKMNYVSCSPFRIHVARLAAAHSVIEMEDKK